MLLIRAQTVGQTHNWCRMGTLLDQPGPIPYLRTVRATYSEMASACRSEWGRRNGYLPVVVGQPQHRHGIYGIEAEYRFLIVPDSDTIIIQNFTSAHHWHGRSDLGFTRTGSDLL